MPSRIVQRALLATAIAAAIVVASAPADAATVDPFAVPPPKTNDDRAPARDEGPPAQDRGDRPDPAPAPPVQPAQPATASPATGSPVAAPAPGNATAHETDNPAAHDCALSLDAAPFLRAATERGIQPKVVAGAACDMNPINNEFFGRGGNVDCKLHFSNARWLRGDVRFTAITGVGSFDAKVTPGGIEVSIPADGGVRFRRVSVQAKVKAGAQCPVARPASVLAD